MLAKSLHARGLIKGNLVMGFGDEDEGTFLLLLLAVFEDEPLPIAVRIKKMVGADFSPENLEVGAPLGLPKGYDVDWSALVKECHRYLVFQQTEDER